MKKKVLILVGTLNLDGATTWTLNLSKYLDQEHFESKVIVFNHVNDNERVQAMVADQNAEIQVLNAANHKLNPLDHWKLYRAIRDYGPDVTINANMHLAFSLRLISKMVGAKNIQVFHNRFDSYKALVRLQEQVTRGLSTRLVASSTAVNKTMGENKRKVVIFNAAESRPIKDPTKYVEKYNLEKYRRVYLNIARHHPQKNQESLVRGFAKFAKSNPDCVLLMVGWGELEDQLKAAHREVGSPENVILTGPISDAWNLYGISDFFVLPSHHEGLPMALVEATGAGTPSIVTDLPELAEIAKGNAIIVKGFDADAIAVALEKSASLSDIEYEQMKRQAMEVYNGRFNPRAMTASYEEVFDEILKDAA